MRKLFACVVAAACLVGGLVAGARAEAPKPIFELPFDGNADAILAGGQKTPITAENLAYAPGVNGQALKASPNTLLEYAVPGNLVQEHGTVLMWFKPNWRASEMSSDAKDWHCLFYERLADGVNRNGSGELWFWFWGSYLRGDISDANDLYKTAGTQGLDPTQWAHLAFTWDITHGSRLYMNAVEVGNASDGETPLNLKKAADYPALANKFKSFYVGSQGGMARADGLIDDLRIYDRALSPTEITAEIARVSPLRLDCLSPFVMEGADAQIRWRLVNQSGKTADATCRWKIINSSGAVAYGESDNGLLAPGDHRDVTIGLRAPTKGEYKLVVDPKQGLALSAKVWVLGRANPYLNPAGKLNTTLIETMDFVKGVPADRFVVHGPTKTASLAGRSYFEAGPKKNDRLAVKVTLPEAGVPYLVEWDYPDDKLRTMEMVAQDAPNPDNDYGLQNGVFCGDEYPNSMQVLTHRSILWARSTQAAFIFMTVRDNAPAAVSELRISRINGGLPDGDVKDAAAVGGWTRTIGIHFEDPSLGYDFGMKGQLMPQYEQTLDRLIAYMKWSGQNLLSYPAVWYHGRMGPGYQPRIHEDDFIACILSKFSASGLSFMPAINLQNIKLPEDLAINQTTVADGSLHNSAVAILSSGKPNPGGWHGTPPNFNPLHPAVRKYVDDQVDDMLDRYASSPAFKGVVLHLTKHTIPWFGCIEAGYNDYCIDAFEKDTGVRVRVDRKDPLRGKLYYNWLMANAREQWIQWRCQQIAQWYKSIADRISARRPDLKLNICSYNPTISDFGQDSRYGSPGFALAVDRESGLDPTLYQDAPNIILTQTIYPADYRDTAPRNPAAPDTAARAALRVEHMQEGTYAILRSAQDPWVNMHDRYFEDGIGGWAKADPLKADWLKETPWRVSTLNPNSRYFLEHFVLPLRFGDVLGYTKGGFLIGTPGVEEQILAFSKAFRALPAAKFADVPGSTQTAKARALKIGQGTWFYAVNTGREPATLSFVFDHAPGAVTDLAAGQTRDAGDKSFRVELAPYELHSFKYDGTASVISVTDR